MDGCGCWMPLLFSHVFFLLWRKEEGVLVYSAIAINTLKKASTSCSGVPKKDVRIFRILFRQYNIQGLMYGDLV